MFGTGVAVPPWRARACAMPCRHGVGCARGLFNELLPGRGDLAAERAGKLTLRRHEVEANPAPEVMAGELLAEEDAIKVHLALPR